MQSIAIVNNERNLTHMLTDHLKSAGYAVRVYHRTDEALDALIAAPADLAFLDKTNPPLGGIELFRRLRQRTTMPVVFLSAWASEVRDELAGSGLEAEGYIDLPFTFGEVRTVVRTVLACERRSDEGRS